jgi:hypothetical protein
MARSTAVATADATPPLPAVLGAYAIAQLDTAEFREVLAENLGGNGISLTDLDRIKIPAGGGTTWEVPTLDGGEATKELVGVIVAHAQQRAFWREEFGGGNAPPDCSSPDARVGHGDPGGDCDDCPFSEYKSAKGGSGRGQACRLVRVLYMVLPHSVLPVVVAVPPGSLKEMNRYFMRLLSQGIAFHTALTRLKLKQAKSADGITYSQVMPEFAGRIGPDDQRKLAPLKEMLTAKTKTVDARDFKTDDEEIPF